ncbi:hypothetical protein [Streptomyces sp. CBMA156]|uniref:hypothetical protein n=1 Tax=Streptomyces sp. CBMA156 TaxID=1930280 RepID=UPI0016621971|nr:hypothetical protein [Streptomyces sp. CBMA156]MBD0670045.1 hypothetical protein [Streptomyces sp. CBMA156]
MSEWFEQGTGVVSIRAEEVKIGMRLAKYDFEEERTILTPVWAVGYHPSPSSGPWARTSDGELHSWRSFSAGHALFQWVHLEIRDEFMPPHPGEWITNVPESADVQEWSRDAHRIRTLELGSRRYTLCREPAGVFWVLREENGECWSSPVRVTPEPANAQFDAIEAGQGW